MGKFGSLGEALRRPWGGLGEGLERCWGSLEALGRPCGGLGEALGRLWGEGLGRCGEAWKPWGSTMKGLATPPSKVRSMTDSPPGAPQAKRQRFAEDILGKDDAIGEEEPASARSRSTTKTLCPPLPNRIPHTTQLATTIGKAFKKRARYHMRQAYRLDFQELRDYNEARGAAGELSFNKFVSDCLTYRLRVARGELSSHSD